MVQPASKRLVTDQSAATTFSPLGYTGPIRAVAIGDSTTAGEVADRNGVGIQVGQSYATARVIGEQQAGKRSWFTHACLRSAGRLLLVNNAGVASDNTDGCLARFQTDVIAWKPNVAFLQMGATNDIQQSLTLAHTQANIAQAVTLTRQAGIVPILVTAYPNNGASFAAPTRLYNDWLRQYAARNGIRIVDPYRAVVDPSSTTGAWVAANTIDGVHASNTGAVTAGISVLGDLSDQGLLAPSPGISRAPFVAVDRTGGTAANLLLNPLMQDDTSPADGRADNWAGSGAAFTLVTDSAVIGKAQQADITNGAQLNFYQQVNVDGTNLAVGDKIAWSGLVKSTAAAGAMFWRLEMYPIIGGAVANPTVQPMQVVQSLDVPWSAFYCETIVPTGATSMRVAMATNTTTGTGTLWLAQPRLTNLTRLGF